MKNKNGRRENKMDELKTQNFQQVLTFSKLIMDIIGKKKLIFLDLLKLTNNYEQLKEEK